MTLGVVALLIGGGCRPKTNAYAPPPAPEVTVSHPVRRGVTEYLEYTGTTEAFEAVELRARVPGFLEKVLFKPGSEVKTGERALDLRHGPTRRQLLEYRQAFAVDGVLLVDAEGRSVRSVRFPRGGELSRPSRLAPFGIGLLSGVALALAWLLTRAPG